MNIPTAGHRTGGCAGTPPWEQSAADLRQLINDELVAVRELEDYRPGGDPEALRTGADVWVAVHRLKV